MNKRIAALALALLAALLVVDLALAAAYLTNGGFEAGALTGWTCSGTCSAETAANAYAGSYFARRGTSSTLSQAATVPDCTEDYRLIWAARQYSAGTHTIAAGFTDCSLTNDTYTPILAGDPWSLHYLDVASCEGDLDFNVQFGGTGADELDAVSVSCLGSGGGATGGATVEAYSETMDDGRDLFVYPTATFGDLALALGIYATAAILVLIAIMLALRLRGGQGLG